MENWEGCNELRHCLPRYGAVSEYCQDFTDGTEKEGTVAALTASGLQALNASFFRSVKSLRTQRAIIVMNTATLKLGHHSIQLEAFGTVKGDGANPKCRVDTVHATRTVCLRIIRNLETMRDLFYHTF